MQHVIYIAGAFRSPTGDHWEIHRNVHRAEVVSWYVWQSGHVALCPHLNTRHFQNSLRDQVWIDGTMEMLRRCDAVLAAPGWENSKGTKAEISEAKSLDRPVGYADHLGVQHIHAVIGDLVRRVEDIK